MAATTGTLDEYGRDQSTLAKGIPQPVITPSGRPSLVMVQMTEQVLEDPRMGRGERFVDK